MLRTKAKSEEAPVFKQLKYIRGTDTACAWAGSLLDSDPFCGPCSVLWHRARPLQAAHSGSSNWGLMRHWGWEEGRSQDLSPRLEGSRSGHVFPWGSCSHWIDHQDSCSVEWVIQLPGSDSTILSHRTPSLARWGLSVVVHLWVLSQPLCYLCNQLFELKHTA